MTVLSISGHEVFFGRAFVRVTGGDTRISARLKKDVLAHGGLDRRALPDPSRWSGRRRGIGYDGQAVLVTCLSGLRSTIGSRVCVQAHRGFKSHRHRHCPEPRHRLRTGRGSGLFRLAAGEQAEHERARRDESDGASSRRRRQHHLPPNVSCRTHKRPALGSLTANPGPRRRAGTCQCIRLAFDSRHEYGHGIRINAMLSHEPVPEHPRGVATCHADAEIYRRIPNDCPRGNRITARGRSKPPPSAQLSHNSRRRQKSKQPHREGSPAKRRQVALQGKGNRGIRGVEVLGEGRPRGLRRRRRRR